MIVGSNSLKKKEGNCINRFGEAGYQYDVISDDSDTIHNYFALLDVDLP